MIGTLKCFFYKSFGLAIRSEIPLSELIPLNSDEDKHDVSVEVSDLSSKWSTVKKGGYFVDNNNNLVMFHVPDTAIFCIKDGNKIIVSPIKGYQEDKIRLYVLGTCMGVLLMQRKVLTLHGSAIAINGMAYAIIGHSGAGKSTLASAFINKGYQLLSDDLVPVQVSAEGVPYVIPSYPQQKLWQESLQEFGMKTIDYRPLFERETKFAVPVKSSFLDETLPLAGVFELAITENSNISLNRIESLARFSTLFNHTFRHTLIPRLDLIEWHFKESARLLKEVKVFQLRRPNLGFTAHELVTNILELIEKEG